MPLPWSSENPCGNEDGVARAGNPTSSEESSAGDGAGADSDSEPDPSPSRFDLGLLRLLDERLADI